MLLPVGLALGWNPGGGGSVAVGGAIGAILLGSTAFAGIGLFMAGTLRAEVNLAAANGLYLILLLLGGMVVPISKLPSGLADFAKLLPAEALSAALHATLGQGLVGAGRILGGVGGVGGGGAGRRGPHVPLGMRARSSAVNEAEVSCAPMTTRATLPSLSTKTA